jgi:hypothetical protein
MLLGSSIQGIFMDGACNMLGTAENAYRILVGKTEGRKPFG